MAGLFGRREGVAHVSISPDGRKVAILRALGGRATALQIFDMAAPGTLEAKTILSSNGDPERLTSCDWATNAMLICQAIGVYRIDGANFGYGSRMVTIDSGGKKVSLIEQKRGTGTAVGLSLYGGAVIDWNGGESDTILISRDYVPEESTGTRLAQTKDGLGVDMLNVNNLRSVPREQPSEDATDYISDGHGNVRIRGRAPLASTGYSRGIVNYSYRKKGSRDWQDLGTVDAAGRGFDPYGVDPTLDVAYGLEKREGLTVAVSKALDGSDKSTLVYAHPAVDVDGFVRIGRSRRIVGVTFVTDKREAMVFDPEVERLLNMLGRALPKTPLIRVVDASEDETKLVIWAGADNNPGTYYVFDKTSKQLEELLPVRDALRSVPLAEMKAVSYPAADGTMIPGYLTMPPASVGKPIGAIILPHGGPSARDEWGFDWISQYLASLGYAVLQPNFRGSAGYGDAYFQKNGFKSWRIAIGDVMDGGEWLLREAKVDRSKLAVVGWSYGGYAALQSAVTRPDLFNAVVAIAPVTDLERLRTERLGWTDYTTRSAFIGTGPHIEEGSPARHADKISAPVMLFHGTFDRNVGVDQSRLMDSKLRGAGKKSELMIYTDLDHYLDDSAARTDMLAKIAAFLKQSLGG